ncbi:Cell division topological specificity factor MinE [Candidatus Syntrophocurvum alkaliphilum]|uniref:Cell division topological specificity factor n=1 Tax=Candidatus Syntrophocurvum alkaliphilum TaxID=2293317 RepID=A0A6I6DC09_9FIRM|nr:cell division topological specificity factor MinE [Candidatus Syntrophocurvum alkaliphilum]QGU00219.1 Cell division topological specificity factor MinE [Candidatus Syntrophocurvum alkaliphilum]
MIEFLKKFSKGKDSSRTKANQRLRLVLSHDRLGASSALMDNLKEEIIQVIAKHVEIDGTPQVNFISKGKHSALDINIPLKGR